MFIDFLRARQDILTDDEARETYKTAADWCGQNGFIVDAMNYYEKIGDYESIISIFRYKLPAFLPYDIASFAMDIFERAPANTCDRVESFAIRHLHAAICLGRWQEGVALAERYEKRFLRLPEGNGFRNRALGEIYFCRGLMQANMSTQNDRYDFDAYFAKMDECFSKSLAKPGQLVDIPIGPWASLVGSARQGAPQEYIESLTRTVGHMSHSLRIGRTGEDDLCLGELKFYQCDIPAAESQFAAAMERAREQERFAVLYRALFYIERIAVFQGNREKAEQALANMKQGMDKKDNVHSLLSYDIAVSWYHYLLRQPEMVRGWLKEQFTPYVRASFIENFGNQMKARYHYLMKIYPPLLAYIEDMKRRESILYGRLEMLAIEACVRFQMKDRTGAFNALLEAYEAASPNSILMPFVELGKDMRALTAVAIRAPYCKIPREWLKNAKHKSNIYAQRQALVISSKPRGNDEWRVS
jgi:ATP/maltotriose-dependent transcriptional regulator MalT